MMPRCVDLPAPVGPNMTVWPRSRTCRFRRNGVAPTVTQCMSAGDSGGDIGHGAVALPVQIEQMKEGLSLGQVGQRPFEMVYKTMMALKDMKEGKAAPADPTYTGLDVCTPETADTCIAK